MAPTNSKANYKSYEAQARMVRAIVAAHPDTKWNYKGKHMHFPFLCSSSTIHCLPSAHFFTFIFSALVGTKIDPSSQKLRPVMGVT